MEIATTDDVLTAFLTGRNASTLAAYQADVNLFRCFVRRRTADEAIALLLAQPNAGTANWLALRLRRHLARRRFSPSRVNRVMTVVRGVTTLAAERGIVAWRLSVPNVRDHQYASCRGASGADDLLSAAAQQSQPFAARDVALLRLTLAAGLQVRQIAALEVGDVSIQEGTMSVPTRGGRASLSLTPEVAGAVAQWLRVRPSGPGPLFCSFSAVRREPKRLSASGLCGVLRSLAGKCTGETGENPAVDLTATDPSQTLTHLSFGEKS